MLIKKVALVFVLVSLGLFILGCSEPSLPEPPSLPEKQIEENQESNTLSMDDIPSPPPLPG
ncbi:hypothetical protein HYX12_02475 [Candidatus Woesearchaeota archaeon]|nr:hypothetical protein [Candidatus Woesearchaeota archaeon]